MANEAHDPWTLLREARESLDKASRSSWDTEVVGDVAGTRNRIDAALAAHDAVPLSEETVDVDDSFWKDEAHRTVIDKNHVLVQRTNVRCWYWNVNRESDGLSLGRGTAPTLDEAKAAAIAAARGMR